MRSLWFFCFFLMVAAACTSELPVVQRPPQPDEFYAVDAGGRLIEELEVGSSLEVGAGGLRPNRLYEFRLTVDEGVAQDLEQAVSFARLTSDTEGRINPFILWYQSGVVGCSDRTTERLESPYAFRTFREAERTLQGARLTVSVHPVAERRSDEALHFGRRAGEPVAVFHLPVAARRNPMVFPSDPDGCLLNSEETAQEDMFVSGRGFAPGEEVVVSVVANQRTWRQEDLVSDLTGENGTPSPVRLRADSDGRFTERVWPRANQRRGTYDIVVQRHLDGRETLDRIAERDIVSFAHDTGFILYLMYPVGGPLMDIAGRPLSGYPYFEFADSFAETDDPVWGAVDPTYVPTGHPGGAYAAYYVVDHRGVAGWSPAMGGSTALSDISGGIEVMPVKAGCINMTDTVIWNAPLVVGEYDVVVEFGSPPAATSSAYSTDSNYDETVDFLDGAVQIGFIVAKDPYETGSLSVGEAEYSQDDFFPTIGGASDVDLRAVVRYPASAAGVETPVASGTHPLFVIQHGNHMVCEVSGHTHASCPDRTPNHKGYMQLLEILASRGIIAVSIDAYDLSGPVPGWIPERGELILKHLELWSHLHDPATFPSYPSFFSGLFNGHVDMSRIAVSGHSRGGEASVAAYDLNQARPDPFSIGSVSSIAPVDFEGYTLPDVPYFVILPAADGDVSNLSGIRIYDRAGGTNDLAKKSGIHVYGANHNFFNTVWADDGDDQTAARDDYIPKADQQRIGESYLSAFSRAHLTGETVYEDMLRGRLDFPSTAGFKIHPFHHESNHSKQEAGSNSGTATGMTSTSISGPSRHVTDALQATWTSSGGELTYTVPVGDRDLSAFEVFSFRAAQTNDTTLNPPTSSQEFRVELRGGGNLKATYTGRFGPIPPPYDHPDYTSDHNIMTTVRIPLHSFIINNSGVDLSDIDQVRFLFSNPGQGDLYVDDIEFSR